MSPRGWGQVPEGQWGSSMRHFIINLAIAATMTSLLVGALAGSILPADSNNYGVSSNPNIQTLEPAY
jgi:hypothetical protein